VQFDRPVIFGVLKIDSIGIGVCWDVTVSFGRQVRT
jgi:hypothetical protein